MLLFKWSQWYLRYIKTLIIFVFISYIILVNLKLKTSLMTKNVRNWAAHQNFFLNIIIIPLKSNSETITFFTIWSFFERSVNKVLEENSDLLKICKMTSNKKRLSLTIKTVTLIFAGFWVYHSSYFTLFII